MRGIPQVLHLDNAAEFKSKALRAGCHEYGIELMYRPVGRPHFGGHIERLNRTLMERVRGLPGATGSSTKGRKARKSETTAALTLREFERWMVLEIAKRYHWSPHKGLLGATPADSWRLLEYGGEGRRPPLTPDAALQFLIRFLPVVFRTIQPDGLTLFRIRYWHPIFSAWKESRRTVTVRYHPEDLSRIFVNAGNSSYLEVGYADLRHPPVTLYEHRRALKTIRQGGQKSLTESQIFRTIEEQRDLISSAKRATLKTRRLTRNREVPVIEAFEQLTEPEYLVATGEGDGGVDYDSPVEAYNVEQW
jgi:putative transposase